jgi:hypothetical protein
MSALQQIDPPSVTVDPAEGAPVRRIKSEELKALGANLSKLFEQYRADRQVVELKWVRNLRQYLGIYDPEIEKQFSANRSQAYPRITRIKCISVLSRIMNLMFPGNERNWSLEASPSPDMSPDDVMIAVEDLMRRNAEAGIEMPLDDEMVGHAVKRLACERAKALSTVIDDQLTEIGGDQTQDYINLNRKVAQSGIMYGLGVLRGPFAREVTTTRWMLGPDGRPMPQVVTAYKPMLEFLPVWDFYPDLSAKTLQTMDGYFVRMVMSRAQVRALAKRSDFFGDVIRRYLAQYPVGNYKAQTFETDLRNMGIKTNVNEQKAETSKYEIVVWHGPVSGHMLAAAGVEVAQEKLGDDIEAEVWMCADQIIKADINPWRKIGVDMKTIHCFLFDEDDTSPIGNGLPNVIRDSQMSIAAATRMLLDNASVTCGPNLELNTDLMRPDQDLSAVQAYKIWYREGMGAEAQYPAIRNVAIDSHMDELLKTIDLFMRFADAETFVGPATGGDMERGKGVSEPMRTAAGASMLRGDAALPFKDIVRNFDTFTQSVIYSLVQFNKKFNPDRAPAGDYNVVARGATSLIAKEIRGMQVDQLAVTLTPEERIYVDEEKLVEARFAVRDLQSMMLPPDEVKRKKQQLAEKQAQMEAQQQEMLQAEVRKTLSDAFKNVAQGQKNSAAADATAITAALKVLEQDLENEIADDKSDDKSQGE